MKKSLRFGLGVALLLSLSAGVLYNRYPDWDTLSNATPVLDGSTPVFQNGLELLGVRKTERDSFTLILNAPVLPRITSQSLISYSPANAFSVEATSSLGHHWKMGWRLDSSDSVTYNVYDAPLRHMGFPDPMLLTELPLAYPPGCRWVDVELSDRNGNHARWRLTHLQTARNIVPSPQTQARTYARNGVFLRLDGRWCHWDSKAQHEWRGELALSGCVTPDPARVWKVEPTGGQLQWASYHQRVGPSSPEERVGTLTCPLPQRPRASLLTTRPTFSMQLTGDYPTANNYGIYYFDLLEYQVGANRKETLLSRTPLSLVAPFQDKGSQEKLYPAAFKPKTTQTQP